MTFSYTQISQYLACPRRYRYQYLDGWGEREQRASMLFGRAFERALATYFLGEKAIETFNQEWHAAGESELTYAVGESWESMRRQGVQLLGFFAQDERVRIPQPAAHLQIKVLRPINASHDFVGFIDAIGELDGTACLIDWKTSASCYPAQPQGLIALDPQLVCYSWLTGITEVALVVFVRKRLPEIQYLRASISADERSEFDQLVRNAVKRIEGAEFPQHSGIRFPQNQCTRCPFIGLCLGNEEHSRRHLLRRNGAELGWLDALAY